MLQAAPRGLHMNAFQFSGIAQWLVFHRSRCAFGRDDGQL
jgi:hypothetical protein